jgi:cyclophilin family peptidyl-prolyl cis-trans isomerase
VVTNKGSFTITLDAATSPGNVNNFVTLARYHYYDATGCHRVLKDFVVQCGRPGDNENAPGYDVPDELPAAGDYAEGVIAMANTGSPDSGGGQWFIITGEQGASLPPSYSIIGTVTKGYDTTVQALENLADPLAQNGVPPLAEIVIESVTITQN